MTDTKREMLAELFDILAVRQTWSNNAESLLSEIEKAEDQQEVKIACAATRAATPDFVDKCVTFVLDAHDKVLTETEVAAILGFYKSPAGVRWLEIGADSDSAYERADEMMRLALESEINSQILRARQFLAKGGALA